MELDQFTKLDGKYILLRPLTDDDAQDIYNWRTSKSGAFLNRPSEYSVASQLAWIKSRPQDELNYIIYVNNENMDKAGMISIVGIDEQNKKAEVGRLLLDEKYLNVSVPYGLEALKITYNLVLNEWKFNKIYGSILSLNTGMIKMQKFLGMDEEGILKKHLYLNNQYVDLNLYSIFTDALNSKYIPKINFLLKGFEKSGK